ncbi:hypothetical protein [Piscinibacterium candidicorallinum]|uniref:Uncharacterized protein n=1 Tax=Piscinibacterium candidicorallinum TaxID=1793872 RepID=A0ABV7H8T7_9BURK
MRTGPLFVGLAFGFGLCALAFFLQSAAFSFRALALGLLAAAFSVQLHWAKLNLHALGRGLADAEARCEAPLAQGIDLLDCAQLNVARLNFDVQRAIAAVLAVDCDFCARRLALANNSYRRWSALGMCLLQKHQQQ